MEVWRVDHFGLLVSDIAFRRGQSYIEACVAREWRVVGVSERLDMVVPTPSEAELAGRASRKLAGRRAPAHGLRIQLDDGEELVLPQAATRLLGRILTEMAQGNAVTLMPVHTELTTQEAADYLNVSRPYLIALLERGQMPFHKVGSHRRVKFCDIEAFAKKQRAKSVRSLDELARQAQELGMGY